MTHAKGRQSLTATELSMKITGEGLENIPNGKKLEFWGGKLKAHQGLQLIKFRLMVPKLTQDYLT